MNELETIESEVRARQADACEKLQSALKGTTLREMMTPEYVEQVEANENNWRNL